MAFQTTNYSLVKPAYNETADIVVINNNMDIIDAKMKEIGDSAGSRALASDLNSHLTDAMPHRYADAGKTYRWGLKVADGVASIVYEEVV